MVVRALCDDGPCELAMRGERVMPPALAACLRGGVRRDGQSINQSVNQFDRSRPLESNRSIESSALFGFGWAADASNQTNIEREEERVRGAKKKHDDD
jgi:hypothetical protein